MKLPKLYRVVKIRFSSLRNGIGGCGGVEFDCDEMVERKARRVRTNAGWKWQIPDLDKLALWDWVADTDQEVLDNSDLEEIEILTII